MKVKSEPAGRLYDILVEAKQKSENEKVRRVWATIFNVPEKDTGAILKILADLFQLVYDTKAEIERLRDIDHTLYLRPFAQIESILSQMNLEAPWKPWREQLDELTIYGLQICSDKLSRSSLYSEIEEEGIEQIKQSLSELTDLVLNSDIHGSLKMFLIRNLEGLRQALLAYRIIGVEGLEQELGQNLGSLLLHRDEIREKSSGEGGEDVWTKYFVFLDRMNKLVATAKNMKSLSAPVLKLLGMDND